MRSSFPAMVAGLGLVTSLCASARAQGGFRESHQTSDDVRISVRRDGVATFEHAMRVRIVAGRYPSLEISSIDPRARIGADAFLATEEGEPIAAHVEPSTKTPGEVRVVVDEGKGLGRGVYLVRLKYDLDLAATNAITRDGAMWRLAWSAPPASEGRDGARVVFDLPPAPTPPRIASPEAAQTTLATLRRSADSDELELVRPHVPRGEAVTWATRIDPKALSAVDAPELAARPAPLPAPERARSPIALAALCLAAIAGALAWVARKKSAQVARVCAERGLSPRTLLPLPAPLAPLAPFAYGAAGAGGFAALSWGDPIAGGILIVLAIFLGAHRAPVAASRPRGPGQWREVSGEEALVVPRSPRVSGDTLDLATGRGRAVALGLVAAIAALSAFFVDRVAGVGFALPIASAVLVPIFATGSRVALPPLPVEIGARVLRPARDALARLIDLAHVEMRVVARFLRNRDGDLDEIRLACTPLDRTPGLRALELAATIAAPGEGGAVPEVFVRYDDGSPAAARIAGLRPGARVVPGRCPEEKVLRLVPAEPTPEGAARLLARLIVELETRRAIDRKTPEVRASGPERRRPSERAVPSAPLW